MLHIPVRCWGGEGKAPMQSPCRKVSLDILAQEYIIQGVFRFSSAILRCGIFPVKVNTVKPPLQHKRLQFEDKLVPVCLGAGELAPKRLGDGIVVAECPAADGEPDLGGW